MSGSGLDLNFFAESCDMPLASGRDEVLTAWVDAAVAAENRVGGDINVIFCPDDYLLEINRKYLEHDYYTDIITFDYSEGDMVSGDLFISVDTVRANAERFGVSFENELDRVVIHGVLHLIGYNDKTEEEQKVMRGKENEYLEKLGLR